MEETCVICGGPHPYYECLATDGNIVNASAATRIYNQGGHGYRPQGETNYRSSNHIRPLGFPQPNVQNNQNRPSGSGSLPSNTIANPRGDLKVITTQSGDGPTIPPTSSPLPKEVEREPEATKDKLYECLALADLGAGINLMPLFVWKKLSLPKLTPTNTHYSQSSAKPIGGDFILEEIEACLTSNSIPPGIDDADFDTEGDILLHEKLLNDDPSSLLPLKELNFEKLKIIKSSIDDPPELELKDLPSHLEYAFLEDIDKLPNGKAIKT
ncbi:hypothetical protein Tco_0969922 [Tanacetum coccineum]